MSLAGCPRYWIDEAKRLERKRIRRALMALRNRLVRVASSAVDLPDRGFWRNGIDELDSATRAHKKGRK